VELILLARDVLDSFQKIVPRYWGSYGVRGTAQMVVNGKA